MKDILLEIRRQTLHTVNGVIIILAFNHFGKIVGFILITLAIVTYLAVKIHRTKRIRIVGLLIDLFERSENLDNPGKGGVTYLLGTGLTIILFNDGDVVRGGLLALTFGDSASTIVGKTLGKIEIPLIKKIIKKKRTVEGTLAFVTVTTILGSLFVPFKVALLSGIIGCLMEIISPIDDNIVLPIFTSLTLLILYGFM